MCVRTCVHVCSVAQLYQTLCNLWTVAHHVLLSKVFSRQEYQSRLLCPPPEDLPDPGIKHMSPRSPELQRDYLWLSHQVSPNLKTSIYIYGKYVKHHIFYIPHPSVTIVTLTVTLAIQFITYFDKELLCIKIFFFLCVCVLVCVLHEEEALI